MEDCALVGGVVPSSSGSVEDLWMELERTARDFAFAAVLVVLVEGERAFVAAGERGRRGDSAMLV